MYLELGKLRIGKNSRAGRGKGMMEGVEGGEGVAGEEEGG